MGHGPTKRSQAELSQGREQKGWDTYNQTMICSKLQTPPPKAGGREQKHNNINAKCIARSAAPPKLSVYDLGSEQPLRLRAQLGQYSHGSGYVPLFSQHCNIIECEGKPGTLDSNHMFPQCVNMETNA